MVKCPNCNGTGEVKITDEMLAKILDTLIISEFSNVELAEKIDDIKNYLRNKELSPLVFTFLEEIWWRLQVANEPIEETKRKIEILQEEYSSHDNEDES